MKRFGSSLREQKPATQKKRDVGWCIKVGMERGKQFIWELCILKPVYGLFHSWKVKNSLQDGEWPQCHHIQASTTPTSRPGCCGDYCSLGIYRINCSPSFSVLGKILGLPWGMLFRRMCWQGEWWEAKNPNQTAGSGREGWSLTCKTQKTVRKWQLSLSKATHTVSAEAWHGLGVKNVVLSRYHFRFPTPRTGILHPRLWWNPYQQQMGPDCSSLPRCVNRIKNVL